MVNGGVHPRISTSILTAGEYVSYTGWFAIWSERAFTLKMEAAG